MNDAQRGASSPALSWRAANGQTRTRPPLLSNIDAFSEAIAVLEKDMAGGSILQGGVGAALRGAVRNAEKEEELRSRHCEVLIRT